MSNENNPKKRRVAASLMAVFTSASMLVGGIFNPPGALPDEQELLPPPVVLDEDDLDGDGKGGKSPPPKTPQPQAGEETVTVAEAQPALPEEEKKGIRRWWASLSFRQRLLLIPLAALAGWGVFALASILLPGVLGKLAAWLMTLGALIGAFLATEKAIFPHIPIKKLLSSRNLSGLAAGLIGLGAADLLLPFVWGSYGKWEALFHALGIVLVFGSASLSFASRTRRDEEAAAALAAQEAETAEPEEEEEEKPMTREDILALADTVSRKRK